MNRYTSLKYWRIMFIVGLLGLVIFVGYNGVKQLSRKAFANRLAQEIAAIQQNGTLQPLEMKQVTTFSWDELFVFGPYVSPQQIEDTLGFAWRQAQNTAIIRHDHLNLLVFVKDNKVVEYLEFPRVQGDFLDAAQSGGLTPDEAVFDVDNNLNLSVR